MKSDNEGNWQCCSMCDASIGLSKRQLSMLQLFCQPFIEDQRLSLKRAPTGELFIDDG